MQGSLASGCAATGYTNATIAKANPGRSEQPTGALDQPLSEQEMTVQNPSAAEAASHEAVPC